MNDDLEATVAELVERVEQLEEENEELRARAERAERAAHAQSAHLRAMLRQVEQNNQKPDRPYWNHFLVRLCNVTVDDFDEDPFTHLPAVKRFGAKVRRHESLIEDNGGVRDAMGTNWENCVAAAENLQNDARHARQDGYVALYADDLQTATGHSRRHCLDLIEELGEDHDGATWQPYESNPNNGGSAQKKALLIDLDVWGGYD